MHTETLLKALNALEVGFKVQDIEGLVKVAELPESSIVAGLTYGLRRLVQDAVNSAAKNMRDESGRDSITLKEAQTLVDARIMVLMDGTLGVRASAGPTVDEAESEAKLAAIESRVAKMDEAARKRFDKMKKDEKMEQAERYWESLNEVGRAPYITAGVVRAEAAAKRREDARIAREAEKKARAAAVVTVDVPELDDGFVL